MDSSYNLTFFQPSDLYNWNYTTHINAFIDWEWPNNTEFFRGCYEGQQILYCSYTNKVNLSKYTGIIAMHVSSSQKEN